MPSARRTSLALLLFLTPTVFGSAAAPAGLGSVRFGTGRWDAATLGNHRALVHVSVAAPAVRVTIPWRRRDPEPQKVDTIVVALATGQRVAKVARLRIDRETGVLAFVPEAGAGDYAVYYMPFALEGRENYPQTRYLEPVAAADTTWAADPALPEASVTAFESIDDFDRLDPMNRIATAAETRALVRQHPGASFLLFGEDRSRPIRMRGDLPQAFAEGRAFAQFHGNAERGEFYSFQVGVLGVVDTPQLQVRPSDLLASGGAVIAARAIRCFNTGGIDSDGKDFATAVSVKAGKVRSLWFGIDIPATVAPGTYKGRIDFFAAGLGDGSLPIEITVGGAAAVARGDDEPERLSRLRWLDSRLAQDDTVVAPYLPVRARADGRLAILGRDVALGALSLPRSLRSFFTSEMTGIGAVPRELLAAPIGFTAQVLGKDVALRAAPRTLTVQAPGRRAWRQAALGGGLELVTTGSLESDGCMEYDFALSARAATDVSDARLTIPLRADVARFFLGMGRKGGARPDSFTWNWKVENNQDSAWVGDVNAGLQFTLKDEHYVRPLNTNFYGQKPLVMPRSWWNDGKGSCRFEARKDAATYLITCSGGPRRMAAGETLHFGLRLLLTPFRAIDPKAQWASRYYHAYKPLDEIAAAGANVVNVHHATDINPYINYPFFRPAQMKAYVDDAHRRGMKVKIYYTVRELTNRAPELFTLLSLGHEVLAPGPGGGPPWLREHLEQDYIAGWYVPELQDAALVTSGVSRWHNFYVEGLAWLVKNVGIDGLYIDDLAFDRTTMKRVRKVLDAGRRGALIDLHSANQFNPRDGWASSANLYLEHFPYLDRLWFGEYFDYDSEPDYWLTEISGIPFGLMGEMLEKGGNPWRGMLYGMTSRLPWAGDPRPLWKFWDSVPMADTRMVGYWSAAPPVRTGRGDVLATTYIGPKRSVIAVASWAKEPVDVRLAIDWRALGLDPAQARVVIAAPAIEKFQDAQTFAADAPLRLEPGKGLLLIVSAAGS